MRLNLGGRTQRIPGFLNVDLYEGDSVDVKSDISKLDTIKDNEVEEIYASHCLEHFSHRKTGGVLREWFRVLQPKGLLYISVPDFEAMVKMYSKFGLTDFVRNMMYGDQEYDLAYHYTIFTFSTLARAVCDAGFSDVKRISSLPYNLRDCSTLVDTFLREPISINCEAVK